jgi:hypothetical protein
MRITPLLCIQCGSWFQPKTKRINKFCCNACRQSNYRGVKPYGLYVLQPNGSAAPAKLSDDTPDEFAKAFVFNFGRDKFGQSAKDWLSTTIQN